LSSPLTKFIDSIPCYLENLSNIFPSYDVAAVFTIHFALRAFAVLIIPIQVNGLT